MCNRYKINQMANISSLKWDLEMIVCNSLLLYPRLPVINLEEYVEDKKILKKFKRYENRLNKLESSYLLIYPLIFILDDISTILHPFLEKIIKQTIIPSDGNYNRGVEFASFKRLIDSNEYNQKDKMLIEQFIDFILVSKRVYPSKQNTSKYYKLSNICMTHADELRNVINDIANEKIDVLMDVSSYFLVNDWVSCFEKSGLPQIFIFVNHRVFVSPLIKNKMNLIPYLLMTSFSTLYPITIIGLCHSVIKNL